MSTDHSETLEEMRRRALVISPQNSALLINRHMVREQKVVGVTKVDLETIRVFDGMSSFWASFGVFLLSGAGWVLVQQVLEAEALIITPLTAVCLTCVAFGALSLGAGVYFRSKKRGRIDQIFDEAERAEKEAASKKQ
ncbi:hypothetical protein [Rhodovulum visakhapatnamense]|uniref:hypothetical protein n=1 Tax=Rhodovulum visakhapatnamense TaxID=364297 RepID=UPI001417075C|nr:hypothetical protein [Rhodovulum visakhapatnamense]